MGLDLVLQSSSWGQQERKRMGEEGIEPSTYALKVRCSTN